MRHHIPGNRMIKSCLFIMLLISLVVPRISGTESLPPLRDNIIPTTLDELWGNYDPRPEPLNVEICREWEQDDVVSRIVRIDIGAFKGVVSKLALFYAFPKGGRKLPGLMHMHGGGQSASYETCYADAKRGYASISINWGGNKLNLGRAKDKYDGLNTDWGALDATHPPQRQQSNHFVGSLAPDEFTLDAIESPRNCNWFIVLVAARRALTFLEQQPEVDSNRLGVYGHSMGGKLTTNLIAIDKRVKAGVPSCGGSGVILASLNDIPPGTSPSKESQLLLATISDNAYIPRIACPVLWLSPTNDFHAHINNMAWNWRMVPDDLLRLSIAPHFNHRSSESHALTQCLFFEEHLKQAFVNPKIPQLSFGRGVLSGAPMLTVMPDTSVPVTNVQVYYSSDPHELTRFWRSAPTRKSGAGWIADCPIASDNQPFFAYANVTYETPDRYRNMAHPPGSGNSTTFTFSTRVLLMSEQQVKASGIAGTDVAHDRMIDEGLNGWQDWYRLSWDHAPLWTAVTRKVKDVKWRGPDGGTLAIDVNPRIDCTLVVTVFSNEWGAFPGTSGSYYRLFNLRGSPDWQTVRVNLMELQSTDKRKDVPLTNWQMLTQLQLSPSGSVYEKDGSKIDIGKQGWDMTDQIRLRNVRWEGGTYGTEGIPDATVKTPQQFDEEFNNAIKKSLEQESLDRKER